MKLFRILYFAVLFVSNEKVSVAYIKHALQMLSIFIEQQ